MINKHSNIVKNCASAAEIVAGIFAYFKEMCNNTIIVAIPFTKYKLRSLIKHGMILVHS